MKEPLSTQASPATSPIDDSDEIDLIELARTVWDGRRVLIKSIAVFFMLGLLIALSSPKQYTATTIMVPQAADVSSKLGGLSGLASMAGINLNSMSNSSDITPTIYPQIISSVPFQLGLMQTKLTFSDQAQPVTLFDYYTNNDKRLVWGTIMKYTIGLPGVIMKAIRGKPDELPASSYNGPIQLTLKQQRIQRKLNRMIFIDYNKKEGYVTLTCNMPEALPAAQLAQHTQKMLQEYITRFKVQKAQANLEFVQQRYDEVKQQYEQAQNELARFNDRNQNVSTAMARTEQERLNNQYNLVYTIYSELAKQLEQAKIQVKEDTPVFTIIEPASVPTEKSKPKRTMILIIWLFLGGIVGIALIFGRQYLASFKEHWGTTNNHQSLHHA